MFHLGGLKLWFVCQVNTEGERKRMKEYVYFYCDKLQIFWIHYKIIMLLHTDTHTHTHAHKWIPPLKLPVPIDRSWNCACIKNTPGPDIINDTLNSSSHLPGKYVNYNLP